jgi:hypothetical protein
LLKEGIAINCSRRLIAISSYCSMLDSGLC